MLFLLTFYVPLDELLNFANPPFPHLYKKSSNNDYLWYTLFVLINTQFSSSSGNSVDWLFFLSTPATRWIHVTWSGNEILWNWHVSVSGWSHEKPIWNSPALLLLGQSCKKNHIKMVTPQGWKSLDYHTIVWKTVPCSQSQHFRIRNKSLFS